MEEFKPLITFIMCCRIKENPDSQLLKFLESFKTKLEDTERPKVELLVKFDTDDDVANKTIYNRNYEGNKHHQPNLLLNYSNKFRHFVYARGEGRYSLHNDYMFLFSQRNPHSKFISFVTDDCFFMRGGFFNELARIKDKDWAIVGDMTPRNIDRWANGNWKRDQNWKNEVTTFPTVSTNLLEILQNMGWQVNIDNWFSLLHVILVNKYNLNLWITISKYFNRSRQSAEYRPKTYNPLDITNLKDCTNPYYFKLVEQQAKNIYLNYMEHNLVTMCDTVKKNFK